MDSSALRLTLADFRAYTCALGAGWEPEIRRTPADAALVDLGGRGGDAWAVSRMRLPAHHRMPLLGTDAGSGNGSGSAVGRWLGRELELRGIDAVVYTRYILSILLQEDPLLHEDAPDFFPPRKAKHDPAVKGRGRKVGGAKRHSGEWDSEKMKKLAAIECLMSVTDEVSSFRVQGSNVWVLVCLTAKILEKKTTYSQFCVEGYSVPAVAPGGEIWKLINYAS